jgi:DNA-binding IclR family transcriptional regulator
MNSTVNSRFKRVHSIDKCFGILDLMAITRGPFAISQKAKRLSLNQSTAFNIVHTLTDFRMQRS